MEGETKFWGAMPSWKPPSSERSYQLYGLLRAWGRTPWIFKLQISEWS